MKYLLLGLGNLGQRRQALLGGRCIATVDPFNQAADFAAPQDCPLDSYEAAILAVPNKTKVALLEFFLERGKHVLVEKPLLFADQSTAERLDRVASSSHAIWYTSYNHRFEPMVRALKQHLDEKRLGQIYYARLFYGNGTVGNVVGSWRDSGLGVLEDLGSHLLDLAGTLFDCRGTDFDAWSVQRNEAHSPDHGILGSADGRFALEVSFVCWRNTFSIDVYGEGGSLHLNGLPKWGSSELIARERVTPSGVPRETSFIERGPDVTWQHDLAHFECMCAAGRTSIDNDWWISRVLQSVAGAA